MTMNISGLIHECSSKVVHIVWTNTVNGGVECVPRQKVVRPVAGRHPTTGGDRRGHLGQDTRTTAEVQEISEEAVEHDQELAQEARHQAQRRDRQASPRSDHRRAEPVALGDDRVPLRARYSTRATPRLSAEPQTIQRGAAAWQAIARCERFEQSSDQDARSAACPTTSNSRTRSPREVESHDKSRRKLDAGESRPSSSSSSPPTGASCDDHRGQLPSARQRRCRPPQRRPRPQVDGREADQGCAEDRQGEVPGGQCARPTSAPSRSG